MVEIAVRAPHGLFGQGASALAAFGEAVDASGLDRVWVGDHVSFRGGAGQDGLLTTMALAAVTRRVQLQTAVYLLPLRHPVPVARQVAGIAELAPGRFVFGVGIGGEDPLEVRNCGVDPATRGRRTDASLEVVRRLLEGEVLDGGDYDLEQAAIRPTPSVPVPVIVGGRSAAALRRAGRLADGWLGIWVDPDRFAASVAEVERVAAESGRAGVPWDHGFMAWCGIGESRVEARGRLAEAMESFYGVAFERFERSSPVGTPSDIADALEPYVVAGAQSILLSPIGPEPEQALELVAEVKLELERRCGGVGARP